ncbi:MAG: hypothetical protein Kow00105_06780 [Phycisphaeraceae bacterium]
MIQAFEQGGGRAFSGRLRQRLAELGVAVVSVQSDGSVELIGPRRWEHECLIETKLFESVIRDRFGELSDRASHAIAVWPGVTLVPLHVDADRASLLRSPRSSPVYAAVLLSEPILACDQLRLVCESRQMDVDAAKARFDRESLLNEAESARMAQVIAWMSRDAGDLGWRLHELHDLSWELAGTYEELGLLYKLSTTMVVNHPPQHFLQDACQEMRDVVGLRWLAIQLDPTVPGLAGLNVPVSVDSRSNMDVEQVREVGPKLLELMHDRTEPVILDDAGELDIPELAYLAHSLLLTPLHVDGKPLGLLYGGDKVKPGPGLSSVDSKLCASLAASLSIYLKNVMLYEDMHSMFLGTLHALSTTIDAKDSYTHGHSERVALMAKNLARAAGMDEQTVERVYLSGLVHDVGKIGVPESVLTKPGKLTDTEFDLIRRHPQIGARILEGIRQMHDLIPGVLYHHESWDGSGYPEGLAGQEIPLFGRIIGLADAFDAMCSDRTYRLARPMHEALDEVRRCSGKQFDPELADIFVKLDFSEYLDMIERHHDLLAQKNESYPMIPTTYGEVA